MILFLFIQTCPNWCCSAQGVGDVLYGLSKFLKTGGTGSAFCWLPWNSREVRNEICEMTFPSFECINKYLIKDNIFSYHWPSKVTSAFLTQDIKIFRKGLALSSKMLVGVAPLAPYQSSIVAVPPSFELSISVVLWQMAYISRKCP